MADLLRTEQACAYLGVSRVTLWRLVHRDRGFPVYKIGGSNRYDKRDLDRYVASRKRGRAA